MDSGLHKLKQTLKESAFSVTKSRSKVFLHLLNTGPVSVGQLSKHLSADLDRATVYRTIELFERLGIVNRIWHGFKTQIELSEIFTPHHHHAVCQNCGKTIDIAHQELEALLAKIAKERNFITVNHSVELSGYCPNCH